MFFFCFCFSECNIDPDDDDPDNEVNRPDDAVLMDEMSDKENEGVNELLCYILCLSLL